MSELEIPARAWKAAEYSQDILKAAAPIIVAAYLRRLAVPYGEREDICAGDRDRLLAEAQELDPQ